MSKVKIQGNASGTGVLTVTAPNTSTDRTITLPDSTGTLATTADTGVAGITSAADATAINILSNERVGINKTTPEARLDISAASETGLRVVATVSGEYPAIIQSASTNTTPILSLRKSGGTETVRFSSEGGILFNGDTAAANALDDYEEGQSTIALSATDSGSITLKSTHNKCLYTKIGRVVHFNIHLRVDSVSSPVGSALITGLPFTNGSSETFRSAVTVAPVYNFSSPSGSMALAYVNNNATTMYVPFYNGSTQTLAAAGYFQANTEAYITGSYMTD